MQPSSHMSPHPIHETLDPASVERAADLILQAYALIVAAGAGMGAIPVCRQATGGHRAGHGQGQ